MPVAVTLELPHPHPPTLQPHSPGPAATHSQFSSEVPCALLQSRAGIGRSLRTASACRGGGIKFFCVWRLLHHPVFSAPLRLELPAVIAHHASLSAARFGIAVPSVCRKSFLPVLGFTPMAPISTRPAPSRTRRRARWPGRAQSFHPRARQPLVSPTTAEATKVEGFLITHQTSYCYRHSASSDDGDGWPLRYLESFR